MYREVDQMNVRSLFCLPNRAHHPSLIISERPRVFIFFFVFLSVFLTLMEEGNQAVASAVGYGEHGMHDIIASKEKYLRKKTRRKDYSISVMQQIHIAHTPHTTHGT